MTKDEALDYFGTQVKLAKALGISQAAISKWSNEVPLLRQYQIERLTGGALKVDDTRQQ